VVNGGNWPLDHDDGSRYIIDRHNVVVYGGTKVRKTPSWPRSWANFSLF
jgi:hypothetical protein